MTTTRNLTEPPVNPWFGFEVAPRVPFAVTGHMCVCMFVVISASIRQGGRCCCYVFWSFFSTVQEELEEVVKLRF